MYTHLNVTRYEEDMTFQKDKIYHIAFKGD